MLSSKPGPPWQKTRSYQSSTKAVIIPLCSVKRAGILQNDYQLLLIQKTILFNLSSTRVVSFQAIQLLKKRKFTHLIQHEMWELFQNYLKVFFFFFLNLSYGICHHLSGISILEVQAGRSPNLFTGILLQGRRKLWPSNRHLSIMLANCADRSITGDAERCGVRKKASK